MAFSYEGRATYTLIMVILLALSSSYMAEAFRRGLIVNKASAPTPAAAEADPPAVADATAPAAATDAPTASPGGGAATVFDITKYGATQNSKDNFGVTN